MEVGECGLGRAGLVSGRRPGRGRTVTGKLEQSEAGAGPGSGRRRVRECGEMTHGRRGSERRAPGCGWDAGTRDQRQDSLSSQCLCDNMR